MKLQLLTISFNTLSAIIYWVAILYWMRSTFVNNFRLKVMTRNCIYSLRKISTRHHPKIKLQRGEMETAMNTGDFSAIADKLKEHVESLMSDDDGILAIFDKLPSETRMVFSFKRLRLKDWFDESDQVTLMLTGLDDTHICPTCKDKKNPAHLCEPVDVIIPDDPYTMSCPGYHCKKCGDRFSTGYTRRLGRLMLKNKIVLEDDEEETGS